MKRLTRPTITRLNHKAEGGKKMRAFIGWRSLLPSGRTSAMIGKAVGGSTN